MASPELPQRIGPINPMLHHLDDVGRVGVGLARPVQYLYKYPYLCLPVLLWTLGTGVYRGGLYDGRSVDVEAVQ